MSDPESIEGEVVYTPQSPLADPIGLLRDQWTDLMRSRELATRLIIRNISARYRQTLLGYFWAIFPMVATTFIWLVLSRRNVVQVAMPQGSYALFLLTGMMLWQTFVDSVQAPLRVVSESKSMLAKINFPREALMLAALGEVLFSFATRLVILIVGWFYLNGGVPPMTLLLGPFGILAVIMYGMTIGVLLVPLGVLFQDVTQGLALVFQVWLLATPVLYPAQEGWSEHWLAWVNPVGSLITVTRDWILIGPSDLNSMFLAIFGLTALFVFFGLVLYRVAMPILIERMQS